VTRSPVLADRNHELDMLRSSNDIPRRASSTPYAGQVLEPETRPPLGWSEALGKGTSYAASGYPDSFEAR